MWAARGRLACLLLSHAARVAADVAMGLCIAGLAWGDFDVSPWKLVALAMAIPAVALAPALGVLCDQLPRPRVLAGAAVLGLVVLAPSHWDSGACIGCWVLMGVRAAIYRVAQGALLPAASADARIGLPRLNALFLATAAGVAFVLLHGDPIWLWTVWEGSSVPVFLVYAFNLAALAFALPVWFASDREAPGPDVSLHSFYADALTLLRQRATRQYLLGSGGLHVLLVAPLALLRDSDVETRAAVALFGGLALGALLAGLQGHPRRSLCFIPIGATGLTLALCWACVPRAALDYGLHGSALRVTYGMMAGLALVPVAAQFQAGIPPIVRGQAMALRAAIDWLGVALGVGLSLVARGVIERSRGSLPAEALVWFLAAATALAAAYAWWVFRREVVEQLVELVFAVMYRFRPHGPGLHSFPLSGPVLVVANHSSWMDPMWLAKVIPRSLIPMTTSDFFDKPLLRWSMVYIADAIRVEASRFRREVPELAKAVAALDQGKCLVLFPEGELRKREDRPLKRFGQGIWHILRERPQTPVVVCWLEGGWGSYFSYFQGPPTKNKPLDFRRPVDIVVAAPQPVPPDILEDQARTRQYLMQQCLALRETLGLPPVAEPVDEAPPA